MENTFMDYFGLMVLVAGGGAVLWFFKARIKSWWSNR